MKILQVSYEEYASTGSYKGLVLNSQQAIILTNDGLVYWHIYAWLSFNESLLIFSCSLNMVTLIKMHQCVWRYLSVLIHAIEKFDKYQFDLCVLTYIDL